MAKTCKICPSLKACNSLL